MHSSLEIITPAVCLDLTILATVKTELGIPQSDISQDEKLATLIKQASGIVADYCNQVFGAEEVLETFWNDANMFSYERSFMLAREPVISITSVVIDGAVLDPSEYRLAYGHLHRLTTTGLGFWCLTSTAEIHYTAGYVLLDNLPYGIERATLSLIKEYHAGFGQNPRVRSEDIPGVRRVDYQIGGSFTDQGSLPPDVTALLWPYRRLAFA